VQAIQLKKITIKKEKRNTKSSENLLPAKESQKHAAKSLHASDH
jgi:hypothetical protein